MSGSTTTNATTTSASTTCSTCARWLLRDRAGRVLPMAQHGFGQCAKGPAWTTYPPQHACAKHQAATAEVVAARITWLHKRND